MSLIVLVNKPSRKKRTCLNYRKVSTQLVTYIHPLSHLEELVENVVENEVENVSIMLP